MPYAAGMSVAGAAAGADAAGAVAVGMAGMVKGLWSYKREAPRCTDQLGCCCTCRARRCRAKGCTAQSRSIVRAHLLDAAGV